jgi:Histidine kinase
MSTSALTWQLLVQAVRRFGWREMFYAFLVGCFTLYNMGGLVSYVNEINLLRSLTYNVLQFGVPYVLAVHMTFEQMNRGNTAIGSFAMATVGTSVVGVWVLGPALSRVLGGESFWNPSNDIYLAFSILVPLGFLSAALWYWHTGRLAQQRLNQSQVDAAKAQQLTQARRLLATQARVEPQFLFDTLQRVQTSINTDTQDTQAAESLLTHLIGLLRAMQPHADARMSTLGREKTIIDSFAAVEGNASWRRLHWELDEAATQAEIAPQFLLPLLRDWLALSPNSPSTLSAHVSAQGELAIDLTCDNPPANWLQSLQVKLGAWQAPLLAVHGERAIFNAQADGLSLRILPEPLPITSITSTTSITPATA